MTDWNEIDKNLNDLAFFEGFGYHDTFAVMRREDPVHWTPGDYPGGGFWSLTRYDDCLAVLDDPETFSSTGGTALPPPGPALTDEQRSHAGLDVLVALTDPPFHGKIRGPFNKYFSVPAVARLRGQIEEIIDSILAEVGPKGHADLVNDIMAPIPANLFLSWLDVPTADWGQVKTIANMALQPNNPEYAHGRTPQQVRIAAFGDMYQYLHGHVLQRRGDDGDDLAAIIANARMDGEYFDERLAGWTAFAIVVGGLETTRDTGAVGLLELLRHPDQAKLVRDDPSLTKGAVEEILRWVNPSKNRLRIATRDVTVAGTEIKKGDWLVLWTASANRDETVFDRPYEFDVKRSPNRHLSFGDGEHLCLGRNVARLELQVLLDKILPFLPDIEIVEDFSDLEWIPSNEASALKRLEITFTPREYSARESERVLAP